jgi:hypothetical protein
MLRRSRIAVSISCEFIMKPPSPQTGKRAPLRIEKRDADCCRQAGSHGCESVIEQQCVGHACSIVPRKPGLVHTVAQTDYAIFRNHLPHVVHNLLGRERKARSAMWARMSLRKRQQHISVWQIAL